MATLGTVLYEQAKTDEAEQTFSRALELCRTGQVRDGLLLGVLERKYGRTLIRQSRFEDAEPLLLSSLDRLTGVLGPGHRRTQSTVRAPGELYESRGKPSWAEQYRERLAPS